MISISSFQNKNVLTWSGPTRNAGDTSCSRCVSYLLPRQVELSKWQMKDPLNDCGCICDSSRLDPSSHPWPPYMGHVACLVCCVCGCTVKVELVSWVSLLPELPCQAMFLSLQCLWKGTPKRHPTPRAMRQCRTNQSPRTTKHFVMLTSCISKSSIFLKYAGDAFAARHCNL